MNERNRAEEDLPVIQTLMERAATYRAISARSALVLGLLSMLAAGAIDLNNERGVGLRGVIRGRELASIWLVIFALSALVTALLLAREARRQNRSLFSPALKLTLRAIAPHLLVPAAFTGWFLTTGYLGGQELELVVVWIVFYGLSLLATSLFAPRSISMLGWTFLLTSLCVPALVNTLEINLSTDVPNLIMGFTFGLYHLVYAALCWRRPPANGTDQ